MKRTSILILTASLLVVVAACSGPSGGTGNVSVLLTDAPLDLSTVSAVNVTITQILLYPSEGEATPLEVLSEETLTINLLDYQNGVTTRVASGDVPAGSYDGVRLFVSAAELVHDHDNDPETEEIAEPIKVPSGMVKVHVPFHVSGGEGMEITVDFDAAASVQVNTTSSDNHEYILRPVVHAVGMNPV